MNKKDIFLIEDHDEALKIWRRHRISGLDLVHVDSHMDFGYYPAKPLKQVFKEAKSVKELKENMEYSIAFSSYSSDFDKQIYIGNYIYPAMQQEIVNNFYWVVPGGKKEFRESGKLLKTIIKSLIKKSFGVSEEFCQLNEGYISIDKQGRKFIICTLEKLPLLKQEVLLDIDVDFLVINSLLKADKIVDIGKRNQWISARDLADKLKKKVINRKITTIAYSVNGGYTPIKYRHLGDELAYYFSPEAFRGRWMRSFLAANEFNLFCTNSKGKHYKKALKFNSAYGTAYNNYGHLYLIAGKLLEAKGEFFKIADVDPKNPYPYVGLGNVNLAEKNFHKAKKYFLFALKLKPGMPQAIFGLGQTQFKLNNLKKAKKLFFSYLKTSHMDPVSRYFLGCICEKEDKFEKAALYYQNAMQLGLNNLDIITKLLKLSCYIKKKSVIINLVNKMFKALKNEFSFDRKLNLQRKKFIKIERKIADLANKHNIIYGESVAERGKE